MHFSLTTSIVALAALAAAAPQPVRKAPGTGLTIPITRRSTLVNPDKTVNIEALNSHVASVNAKILRGLENFERNTGAPHPADLRGNERRRAGTGTVPLTDHEDDMDMWYGDISVGSPQTTFIVIFDTGSRHVPNPVPLRSRHAKESDVSDLFLPGPKCTANCEGHTIYNPSSSSSAKVLGGSFTLEYGHDSDLNVLVEAYTDHITVGGLTPSNLKASDQTLGVATHYSPTLALENFPADGLMGMAFDSLSQYEASPVFQTLVSQGMTTKPAFSFKLASPGSELFLGGANSNLYTGDFTYTPVTNKGYWEVNMDSIEGNGQTRLTNINSVIDTGSTLIIGDPHQVAQLHHILGGTDASETAGPGTYTYPCNRFPSISFTFGGRSFPISRTFLNHGRVSPGSNQCICGIIGIGFQTSFWIIGDVFLLNVYTTFDVENMRVGFAKLAD